MTEMSEMNVRLSCINVCEMVEMNELVVAFFFLTPAKKSETKKNSTIF